MSTNERNKGTLLFVSEGVEAIAKYNELVENQEDIFYLLTDAGKLYEIQLDIDAEQDCSHFSEIAGDIHGTRELDFHTLHYNGSGSLQEVLQAELDRMVNT